jgi:protein-export membrane protein SecD
MSNILEKIFADTSRAKVWRAFAFILVLVLIGGYVSAGGYYNKGADWLAGKGINLPKANEIPFRLGLDLQGGTHLVYLANMEQIPEEDRSSALEGVRDVIERRVNVFGVSEPLVQVSDSGEPRVIVELAGIKDVNEAIEMIGETPLLEFKEQEIESRDLSEEERNLYDQIKGEIEGKKNEILEKLNNGEDFAALARQYSQQEASKEAGGDLGWIRESDYPELIQIAKNLQPGEAAKSFNETSLGYELVKLEGVRDKTDPFTNEAEKEIKASHILICHEENEGCESGLSKDDAYSKIKSLKERATPANFSQLAKENSTEPGAETSGGDLGWFGRGRMVEPFEEAVFGQQTGTISFVVETMFGYHIIYKQEERITKEYNIRHIALARVTEEDIIGSQNNWKNTELTGKNLKKASVQFNPNDNSPEVGLEFDNEGAEMFAAITERNIGSPVAIFLDGEPISIPTVNEKIPNGKAVISGNFNISDAKLLAQRLNAGALPVPIELVSQQTVGASLGKASLSSSLEAGIIGIVLVAIFMIVFYRVPGVIAVISLIFYGILILAVFKLWPVTLTLAGLAGLILSIGMAVDANVLIFERLKEELRSGKPLNLAIDDAFDRAWPSIRDGNASTLITCFILIQFTTSMVKGFAITLGLGILISMFSAIVITKTLLKLSAGDWLEKRLWLAGVKK